jgi:hypothetical protein
MGRSWYPAIDAHEVTRAAGAADYPVPLSLVSERSKHPESCKNSRRVSSGCGIVYRAVTRI